MAIASLASITGSCQRLLKLTISRTPALRANARLELRHAQDSDNVLSTLGLAYRLSETWSFLGKNTLAASRSRATDAMRVNELLQSGVDHCFTNPGTSEMHFVAALDRIAGMRCVLCLQENVATGAADGYYRITGKPAATLLHCGPGLANGLANLHNARRARSGIVNVVGQVMFE